MKHCVECKHHREDTIARYTNHVCDRPHEDAVLGHGTPLQQNCHYERHMGTCGMDARFWEPVEQRDEVWRSFVFTARPAP
jgi:hypothetical protein